MITDVVDAALNLGPLVGTLGGMILGGSRRSDDADGRLAKQPMIPDNINITDAKQMLYFCVSDWIARAQRAWWSLVLGISFLMVLTMGDSLDPDARKMVFTMTATVIGYFYGRDKI